MAAQIRILLLFQCKEGKRKKEKKKPTRVSSQLGLEGEAEL